MRVLRCLSRSVKGPVYSGGLQCGGMSSLFCLVNYFLNGRFCQSSIPYGLLQVADTNMVCGIDNWNSVMCRTSCCLLCLWF